MTTDLVTVRPDTSIGEALQLLVDHNISGVPVVDDEYRIVGILSEKDVLKVFYEDGADVAALMTRDPVTISVDEPLADVVDTLMTFDFRRVLIHERGKLVGLISRADLMPAILEALLDRVSEPPPSGGGRQRRRPESDPAARRR